MCNKGLSRLSFRHSSIRFSKYGTFRHANKQSRLYHPYDTQKELKRRSSDILSARKELVHLCLITITASSFLRHKNVLVLEAFLFLGFLVRCLVDRQTTFQRVSQRPLNGILVAFYAQHFLG